MRSLARSSRLRYRDYKRHLKDAQPDDRPRDVPLGKARSKDRARGFTSLFVHLVHLARGHWAMLALVLMLLTFSTLFGLAPIAGFKPIFDTVLGDKPLPAWVPDWVPAQENRRGLLVLVAGGMVGFAALAMLISIWSRWQATRISHRVRVNVRRRVFQHAVRLPLHRVQAIKSGGVSSMLREDAGAVGDLIFSMIYNPWRAIVQLVASLVVLALIDWRLLLGAMVILPVVWLTHRTWINRIRPMFRDVRATRRMIDGRATEAFGGMRVVRTFTRERSETGAFTASNHFMTRQELRAWWWMRSVDMVWQILIPLASALVLLYGGIRILNDAELLAAGQLEQGQELTAGDLVVFLGFLGALLSPIQTLAQSAAGFQNALAGLDRVLDLFEEPTEMADNPDARVLNLDQVQGRLTAEHVTFHYPETDEPAVRDVSFDVLPGQTVAFVGPSGAGKSTMCNLIARFYDPDEGSIKLDGVDLREINIDSYRSLLGIVEQDIFLFDGSIAENIGYANREASLDQIIAAATAANAHEFIDKLPEGYDSFIGERGVKLSGGQRQRLAIARALLADPKLLILDEATSNLDTESERLIQASLQELMATRTSFVIAHRLSTITHADQILVIEGGRVIEAGRHEDLMRQSGRYRQMIHLQLSASDVAAMHEQPAP
ncbi:ABC transporter ATP-binding protein [Phycisphaerales bacterium AB-hyl4]|uniref:ABC transporter ATP-binding protein n=1 Tax=Natronomicrosphaera hydrolytica TaxID=3242702 RepID=A0ABV4U697_9BACT